MIDTAKEQFAGERSRFDPMSEATWTLGMAVYWIRVRDPDRMRDFWGEFTKPGRLPTLSSLSMQETVVASLSHPHHPGQRLSDDQTALWQALTMGDITANALGATADSRPAPIPCHEWPYLTIRSSVDLEDELAFDSDPLHLQYREVTLRRFDVWRLWPSTPVRMPLGSRSDYPGWSLGVGNKSHLYLAEAIEWIMIGREVDNTHDAASYGWDEAERELFDTLSQDATAPVEGYRASDPSAYRSLRWPDRDIWARMNREGGCSFSPIDEGEKTARGGTVIDGHTTWHGVRLPTAYVLERWPRPKRNAPTPETARDARLKKTVDDGIAMLEAQDKLFLGDNGTRWSHKQWTKEIAPKELGLAYHKANEAWDKAGLSPGFRQRRRPPKAH